MKKHNESLLSLDPEDIGVCNCAMCRVELLGEHTEAKINSGHKVTESLMREFVAMRIDGRPYCRQCVDYMDREEDRPAKLNPRVNEEIAHRRIVRKLLNDDHAPSLDNGVRELEDAGE